LRISWVSGQSLDISFEWCESCLLAIESGRRYLTFVWENLFTSGK